MCLQSGVVKGADHPKQSRSQKVQGTSKNEKSVSSRSISAGLLKKNKDGKDADAASVQNGSVARQQPIKSSILFNERKVQLSFIEVDIRPSVVLLL